MCVDGRYSTCNSGLLLRYMSRVCRVYIVVVVVYSEKYKRKKGKRLPLVVLTVRPPFLFPLGQLLLKKTLGHPPQKPERKLNKSKLYYYQTENPPPRPMYKSYKRESLVCWTFCCAADAGQGEKNKIKIYTQQQKSFKKKKKKKGKPHLLIRRTFPLELFFFLLFLFFYTTEKHHQLPKKKEKYIEGWLRGLFSFFFLHIATPFDERLVERRIRISLDTS